MKLKASSLFYILTLGGIISLIVFVLNLGKSLQSDLIAPVVSKAAEKHITSVWGQALSQPLTVFIMQLVVIILVAQLFAAMARRIGQPAVVGEIVAGIALGPSLLGLFFPEFSALLFPKTSMGNLQMLSQVGLILFMFVIGMELNLEALKKKAGSAVIISHASIVIPYALGVILAYFLYRSYAPANIPFYAFALFIGIAMSITAFPVLARIIKERNMVHTRLGTIALTCAAADDITAWCLLAFVIAIVKAGSLSASAYTIILTVLYIAIMLYAVKPLLRRIVGHRNPDNSITRSSIALMFTVLLLSAFVAELIGIHALFGAFLAGVIMPQGMNFREQIIGKTEDVATILLLPLFFVFTGLRTQIDLLNDAGVLGVCLLITVIAIIGKFGGSALAARVTGEGAYGSLTIGALMNTRGLVELVVLNIGYDLGVLSPQLFTMFVIMALVTTFMTNPLLNMLNRIFKREAD
jgi:Kef-type K+ transport system membrane component KefB